VGFGLVNLALIPMALTPSLVSTVIVIIIINELSTEHKYYHNTIVWLAHLVIIIIILVDLAVAFNLGHLKKLLYITLYYYYMAR